MLLLTRSRFRCALPTRWERWLATLALVSMACSRKAPSADAGALEHVSSATPPSHSSGARLERPRRERWIPKNVEKELHLLQLKVLVLDPSGAGHGSAFVPAIRRQFASGARHPMPPVVASSFRWESVTFTAPQKVQNYTIQWTLLGADGDFTDREADVLFLGAAGILYLVPEGASVDRVSTDIAAVRRHLAAKTPGDEDPSILGHDVLFVLRTSGKDPASRFSDLGFPVVASTGDSSKDLEAIQESVLTALKE